MFTGIIEEVGSLKKLQKEAAGAVFEISCKRVLEGLQIGDSIAANGVCLTATAFTSHSFTAAAMHETLRRSTLGNLHPGSPINLERAMAANGRFGGHMVAGHIDGTGTISNIEKDGNAVWYTLQASPQILRYIVEKGSVALDGISLTVAEVRADYFKVSVIPHTLAQTALAQKRTGDCVNIENDIIGKYVEKLLGTPQKSSGITKEFLSRYGF
ncbi:MAG: riboflavin synthase [Oscillospiraceae bacterium]|nr:riboflavin synthase [Oscillospiraceae bacterium]MCI9363217.1 riboflavin synthase [Oscillospiraceae bacterium]